MEKRERLYKLILTVQGLLMIVILAGPFFDGSFDFTLLPLEWHKSIGFLLNLSGTLILMSALRAMHGSFTIFVKPRTSGDLVTHGIFSFTRNPIYFGGLLMCFGWSISFGSLISTVCSGALCFVLLWKITHEQVELEKRFGESYRSYRNSTAKLVPFLW